MKMENFLVSSSKKIFVIGRLVLKSLNFQQSCFMILMSFIGEIFPPSLFDQRTTLMHREGEPWTGSCDQCWRSPGDRGQSGTALYLGNVWVRVFM